MRLLLFLFPIILLGQLSNSAVQVTTTDPSACGNKLIFNRTSRTLWGCNAGVPVKLGLDSVIQVTSDPGVLGDPCSNPQPVQLNTSNKSLWICTNLGWYRNLNLFPITTAQLNLADRPDHSFRSSIGQPAYAASTDGTGFPASGSGSCAMWNYNGVLIAGNIAEGECLFFINKTVALGSGYAIHSGSGILESNHFKAAIPVSSLSACDSSKDGQTDYVSDALLPTYLGAVSSGGSVRAPVFCDGNASLWKTY